MRLTLRAALASTLVVTAIVVVGGFALFAKLRGELTRQTDVELAQLAGRPIGLILRPQDSLAQLRGAGGQVLTRTPQLEALGTLPSLRPGYRTIALGGRELRVYTRLLPSTGRLSVARDITETVDTIGDIRRLLILGCVGGAAIALGALLLAMRAALAPVRRTAEIAETVGATSDLTHRVAGTDRHDDLGRLVRAFNHMLDRLEGSDATLRRFVADASHEFRTPVTTIRGNVELLVAHPAMDPAERQQVLHDVHHEIDRMQVLIADMLDLARIDAVRPRRDLVRVVDLIPKFDDPDVVVAGDRLELERLVQNLVDNAERYGGGATTSATMIGDRVELRVVDHGDGIAPSEAERVFERFHRGAGTQGTTGSGLGLAIARGIALAHRGELRLEQTPGGGATFVLTLPRASNGSLPAGPSAQ